MKGVQRTRITRWKVILLLVLLGICVSFAHSQSKPERIRWEYKVFTTRPDSWPSVAAVNEQNNFLNAAGMDGWELVTVESGQVLHVFYLKRRLQ